MTETAVPPDRHRAFASRFVAIYPDGTRRLASHAMNMTVDERANLDRFLDGKGAEFRPGFFTDLERVLTEFPGR